ALFGLIISLIIIILIQNRKKTIKYVLVVSIIIALSILILNPSPSLKNDFERKWQKRSPLLLKGIEIIREKPFTGVGINRFRYSSGVEYYSAHAHNHLIHIAAELGIQALIAYLAIMIGTGYMCLKVYWNSDIEWMRTAILGLGGGQLAHFFFGLGDSIPLGAKPGIIFWISLALITAIYNYHVQIGSSR
ncbi:MAG: O-antigen ligase family protein, partial [Candidatus Aminicenantes bacterium]